MSDAHGHAPAAGGNNAAGKAIGIGFLVLILANGNMPANTQFALIAGIAAYFVISKGSKPAAGGH